MNTFGKLFFVSVCVVGVAAVVGITKARFHRSHADVNSIARMASVEPIYVKHRHNRSSMRMAEQSASIRSEPITANADPGSPDSLEDPDQIRAWARSNPQNAREWLAGAAQGTKRDTVAEMVCLQIAETNPPAAVALADGYGAGCTNVLENLVMQWADQNVLDAYNWAAAKPPGAQRDALLSRIAFVESKTDPQDAATLVAQQIPAGQNQDEAAISVISQWALKDPNAAMKWAQSFSAGTLHDRAINEVRNVMASNSQ